MSKDCKIIEDLLPLYHDGICSQESREMVEAHLAQCEDCRKILEQIDSELLSPSGKEADIDPLKSITKKVSKIQRKSLLKGIVITLAVLLCVFVYTCILWYIQEYTYYTPFTEDLTQMPLEHPPGTARYYYFRDDTYQYAVFAPYYPTESSRVSIEKTDENGSLINGAIIKRGKDTKYIFYVNIFCEETYTYHFFAIDSDLNLCERHYRFRSDKEQVQAELEEDRAEVQALIDAAKAKWPFIP